jgi:dTDP-4-dehydrorhamnose 3,5-epimerase
LIFTETKLPGAFVIEPEMHEDHRGFFARTFCEREFEAHGLNPRVVQCNISFNRLKGSLRGMHFQASPHSEAKLVRCTAGSIYDVIIDLRPSSSAFKKHFGVELSARNRKMLYIPEGQHRSLLPNVPILFPGTFAGRPVERSGLRNIVASGRTNHHRARQIISGLPLLKAIGKN